MCVLDGSEKKQDCIVAVILKDDRSFSSYNLNQKRDIITNGPPKPKELPFLVTKKTVNRPNGKKESYNCKFRSNLYDKHDWMCACSADEKTTGGLFCWPCLLFNNDPSVRTWKAAPFRDMNNVTNEAKRHTRVPSHLHAVLALTNFGSSQRIDLMLDQVREREISMHNQNVMIKRYSSQNILVRNFQWSLYGCI